MAVYIVTGSLGSGKSLLAVRYMQQVLFRGGRIATNMDLRVEKIVTARKSRDVYRLPDHPRLEDLEELGHGYAGKYDEKKFGAIVLDEAAIYLNARSWNAKEGEGQAEKPGARRMKLINWLRHARKFGWDVLLITQDIGDIDSQIRSGLAEHVVYCKRMDRLALPIVSLFTKMLGLGSARMPQVHVGVVRYGTGPNAPLADRWVLWYGQEFHGAYDTRQRILGDIDGPASMLDARHAPYLWEPRGWREWVSKLLPRDLRSVSVARQRRDDFRWFERGLPPYKPAAPTYSEWFAAQRVTAPEGAPGGELGVTRALGGEGEAALAGVTAAGQRLAEVEALAVA